MKKIVYLPLDERPCNYNFPPLMLGDNEDYKIVEPPMSIMGQKKIAADFDALKEFLLNECADSFGLIISIDALLYGGIVPSRLHNFTLDTLKSRLSLIDEIKRINGEVKIYAFSLIMRCPQYSSADEEPDYYGTCGYEIFKLGEFTHKNQLGILTEEEKVLMEEYKVATKDSLDDYLKRRNVNTEMNLEVIDLVGEVIDYLIIPQDDSSLYGYIAFDQKKVRDYAKESKNYLSIAIYPGADEVGMTLLARMINSDKNLTPTVAVNYASVSGMTVIPLYEDRPVGETIKMQIIAAGGIVVEDSLTADIVLMVNSPSSKMTNANMIHEVGKEYNTERTLTEFVVKMQYLIKKGKLVSVADVAYVNGGDTELVSLMEKSGLLFEVAGYSGWNTSSNTLGTCISQAMIANVYKINENHKLFLAERYYEDVGYCSYTRKYICENFLPQCNLNYFDSGEKDGEVSREVKKVISDYIKQLLPTVYKDYFISECTMPWKRMFEVDLKIKKRESKNG